MLMLLTLAAPSSAASVCALGASPAAATPACACVRLATTSAGAAGPYWLGGVTWSGGTGTPGATNCFDYGAAMATVSGPTRPKVEALLRYAGESVALSDGRTWLWDLLPGASTLMSDVLEGDTDKTPPVVFPLSPGLWELRNPLTGVTEATVASAAPPSGAFWADLDGDQLDDLVIGFADGSLFEVTGWFDPFVPLVLR